MAAYQTQQINVGSIAAPEVGKVFKDYASVLNQNYQQGLDKAIQQAKYEEELGFRKRDEQMRLEDRALKQAEKTAQAEATRAVLDPEGYKKDKLATERALLDQSIAGLSDVEKANILKQYNPEESGRQWVSTALGGSNVDQGKLLDTQKTNYAFRASMPGTPEYNAVKEAEKEMYKWKSDMDLRKQLAVRNADKAEEKAEVAQLTKALYTDPYVVTESTADKQALDVQDKYAKLYNEYIKLPGVDSIAPDKQFEGANKYALSKLGISALPEYKPTKQMMSKEAYTKALIDQIDPKNLTTKGLQTIQGRVGQLYTEDKKDIAEAKKIAGYKVELARKGIDTAGINDSDVLKDMYETATERKLDKGTHYGAGPLTLEAMNNIGIDTWGQGSQKELRDFANKYKIHDKDLAGIISESDDDWTPTTSTKVVDRVKEYIQSNYKEK